MTEALKRLVSFKQGRYRATLRDALKWEEMGLGRVFFEDGVPTWYSAPPGLERDPK